MEKKGMTKSVSYYELLSDVRNEKKKMETSINNYQIEMLEVQDADAFIIFYEEVNGDKKLVLVDAGRYSNGEEISNHLKKYYPNKNVDLAIVTHCDEDHFGGFVYLLENNFPINCFWINIPKNHKDCVKIKNAKDLDCVYSTDVNGRTKNLIELLKSKNIKHFEKFASENTDDDFPFFHIIGPTKQYYESLLLQFRFDKKISPEIIEAVNKGNFSSRESLSSAIDNAEDDKSAHNKSSIIFTFEPELDKKYLFMGDANKESFNEIPDDLKEKYAQDVFWLKVPHHGSDHNLDSEMISYINPKVAYVSTAKIDKYLSMETVNALSKIGCKLYSTHKEHCNFLHNGFDGRSGYSATEPFNQKQLEDQK